MINEKEVIIEGIKVKVTRKRVKRMTLKISNETGEVNISAPHFESDEHIRTFVLSLKDRIEKVKSKAPIDLTTPLSIITEVKVWGQMRKVHHVNSNTVKLTASNNELYLHHNDKTEDAELQKLLDKFYSNQLKIRVGERLPILEDKTNLHCSGITIKTLKSKWGSCNTRTKEIILNSKLARKSPVCLDYIISHELLHLRISGHGKDFHEQMNAWWKDIKPYERMLKEE